MPPSIDRILLSTFSSPILPPAVDVLAIMSRLIAHPSYLSHDNLSTLSIAELAEQAQKERGPTDPSLSIKHWLRFADQARQAGRRCVEDGHYERAFIEYAKSAMAVVEVIPAHKDYRRLLTDSQGHNLGLHGQDILDALSEVKQIIVMARDQERGGHIVPSPIIPTSTRGEDSSREAFDGAEVRVSIRPLPPVPNNPSTTAPGQPPRLAPAVTTLSSIQPHNPQGDAFTQRWVPEHRPREPESQNPHTISEWPGAASQARVQPHWPEGDLTTRPMRFADQQGTAPSHAALLAEQWKQENGATFSRGQYHYPDTSLGDIDHFDPSSPVSMIYSPPAGLVAVSPLARIGSPASISSDRFSYAKSVLSVSSAKTTMNQYIGRSFPAQSAGLHARTT